MLVIPFLLSLHNGTWEHNIVLEIETESVVLRDTEQRTWIILSLDCIVDMLLQYSVRITAVCI